MKQGRSLPKEDKIRISRKGDKTVYIYYMADDKEKMPEQIGMSTYSLPERAKVRLLGTDSNLSWHKVDRGFIIKIPDKIRETPPSKFVWVFKATF